MLNQANQGNIYIMDAKRHPYHHMQSPVHPSVPPSSDLRIITQVQIQKHGLTNVIFPNAAILVYPNTSKHYATKPQTYKAWDNI